MAVSSVAESLVSPAINWEKEKTTGSWRTTLYEKTQEILKKLGLENRDLSELNALGIYHKVAKIHGAKQLARFEKKRCLSKKWVALGQFPGIWCALFNLHNTYSNVIDLYVLKFTFKKGYQVFDRENKEHQKIWNEWQKANVEKQNNWSLLKNDKQDSLSSRLKHDLGFADIVLSPSLPHHEDFYKEYKFGAAIGYGDYMALIILLPECVETVVQAC